MDYTYEDIMVLATVIGDKVAAGQLPPKDEHGFYIL